MQWEQVELHCYSKSSHIGWQSTLVAFRIVNTTSNLLLTYSPLCAPHSDTSSIVHTWNTLCKFSSLVTMLSIDKLCNHFHLLERSNIFWIELFLYAKSNHIFPWWYLINTLSPTSSSSKYMLNDHFLPEDIGPRSLTLLNFCWSTLRVTLYLFYMLLSHLYLSNLPK